MTARILLTLCLCATPGWAGDWSARFDLTLNRVLTGGPPHFDDAFVLADAIPQNTRRFTSFSGDVSGRYIGALSAAARHTGRSLPQLERVVVGALQLQKPDGHFGAPMSTGRVTSDDMATLWGNGRMLIGLLEYHALQPHADVLASARKLGDFLVRQAPRFNSDEVRQEYNGEKFAVGYICWTSNLEGLVELYRVTGDGRYLALARDIASRTDRHPSQHSHGFLSTVRGIVQLYRATNELRYLEQAKREWRGVIASGNVLLHGAVPEMFAPAVKRDEGCSEADWLRLSLDLWELTRDPEYLRQAELTLFNEFAFNQFHTGDFGHHLLAADGIAPDFARAWWCCTFHGLRAMAVLSDYAFHESEGALVYDLPVDARGGIPGLEVQAESSLERDGTVRLTVLRSDEARHALRVRVPEWASEVKGAGAAPRVWKAGDTVVLTYVLRTREVKRDGRTAVFRGPWLLAVDEQTSPGFFDEPYTEDKVQLPAETLTGAQGYAAFQVPAGRMRVRYLPGGYPVQPGTALLHPMAEYTGGPDSNRLVFWLP